MTYGIRMDEDAPRERLTCGCLLWGERPLRGCLEGQETYRRVEGLSMLIAVWARLAGKELHRDPDWKPHDHFPEASTAWQNHLEAGGHVAAA